MAGAYPLKATTANAGKTLWKVKSILEENKDTMVEKATIN